MDMQQLLDTVGREYWLPLGTGSVHVIQVRVKVTNLRSRYGKIDAHVIPVGGKGDAWVEHQRLIPITETQE